MKISAVRGMPDILPDQSHYWEHVIKTLSETVKSYGYQSIQLPLLEKTELFKRSIGDDTDIVTKEMYTFDDRNGDSLTLRPEGTAGCVRAAIERGLLNSGPQRVWYYGPMFRYERPQKGRFRQFHQVGVEAFGMQEPIIDAEMLMMSARLWQKLGLKSFSLDINCLGTLEARQRYIKALTDFLSRHKNQLDEDSQRRLNTNPLRILDSKNTDTQKILQQAPLLNDYLDEACQKGFKQITELLDNCSINYTINPRLVRGLDYYNGLVFEWVTDKLGAQGTFCAGGRYDGLVEQLGGKPIPATGFAIGLERLISLLQTDKALEQPKADFYLITLGESAIAESCKFAEQLRQDFPHALLIQHATINSLKSQLKSADKSQAAVALVLGEDEIRQKCVMIKPLRGQGQQQVIPWTECNTVLSNYLKAP